VSGVALERATPADVTELGRLLAAESPPPSLASLEREQVAGRLWVLRSRRGIVAWGSVRLVADELQIEDLAVAPERRRRGWGLRLLRALLEVGRRRGLATAHLEVRRGNAAARALYRRGGFEEVGERREYYREPREDAILMRRRLTS